LNDPKSLLKPSEPPAALRTFAELLRASPHNLLSPKALEELETRHFPEALHFAASLPSGVRVLDLGSGGGLPGIVIALVRDDLQVHLMDATKKKCVFLEEARAGLDVTVTVHHGRAEDLARGPLRGAFDVVTARAVAPLKRLVPWAAPYLRSGGRLHAIKGERWREELEAASGVLRRQGMEVVATPAEGEGPIDGVEVPPRPRVVVLERRSK
jgi:16S rRNA (guanine527-N7)-methyltransferase